MKKITLLFLAILSINFGSAQFSEDFNGATFPPAGWAIYPGANGLGTAETWQQLGTAPDLDARCIWELVTPATAVAEDWIVTPLIQINATQNELTFNARDFNTPEFGSILSVRVSTTSQTDTTTFTEIGNYNETALGANTGPQDITIDLAPYLNQGIYIAFIHINNDGDAVAIDDISVSAAPACAAPASLSFTDFTTTTADLSWTNSGDFEIRYGEFPYALRDMGGITANVTGASTYQLTALTPGVSYNVFVRQSCAGGLLSDWEEILVGTSPDLSNVIPYTEDLEPDANQALLLNLGTSFFSNTNNWQFGQDNLADGDTSNDVASDGISFFFSNNTFTTIDADATLYFGPFTLAAGNQYTFGFDQRNRVVSDATVPNKDIEIVAATTNDGTTNTVLATFDDMNNIVYQVRNGSFTPSTSGDYYFGIRDKSNVLTGVMFGNSVFIDAITLTSTLSVDEVNNVNLNYFFNSRTGTFNIEITQGDLENIKIYNLLGQQVVDQIVNDSNASIDMNNVKDGIYIAQINFEGETRSIKFVK